MFVYDAALLAAVATVPQTVADVVQILETIEATCVDGDGLKWFNGLYLDVTRAVEARVNLQPSDADVFGDAAWIASLDVGFAQFYFDAIRSSLSSAATPGCWQAVFGMRNQTALARIQFALAGMNAHINHDLPQAVAANCRATGIAPDHGTTQYADFMALNATLDSLIQLARKTLRVRLLGDVLPAVNSLEDTFAAWNVSAARESAWNSAELLWHLADAPLVASTFLDTLGGLTSVASKALLVPVP